MKAITDKRCGVENNKHDILTKLKEEFIMSKKLLYSMMAGIFSVGMLAACGDGGTDEMDPGDPVDPGGDEMGEDNSDM